ncbi:MAG: PD40 domain-containing protein [Phycisphaerales bacterium]|nr:MAG: PD40 domain-containing protein [Phycisphaerales bacterium]
MMRINGLIIGLLVSASAMAPVGCSGSNPVLTRNAGPTLNAQARIGEVRPHSQDAAGHDDAPWADAGSDTAGYGALLTEPRFANPGQATLSTSELVPPPPPAKRDTDPHAALIGLYGELVSRSPAAAQPGDGAGNLAQVSFANEGACFNPDVDRTGQKLVFASTMHRPTADIYWKRPQGQTLHQLTSDPANDIMPTYSGDGWIAFASDRSGSWDLYLMPADGGPATQITTDTDPELHPSFSPDGRSLAYCRMCTRSGRWEIWVIDLQDSTTPKFLTYGLFPQWCPDVAQSKILFQRARQRGSRYHSIWTIDYLNGEAKNHTEIVSAANAAVINPAWSPDGRKIVFVTEVNPGRKYGQHPEQSDLWVINVDGTGRTALTAGQFANFEPVWAADGSVYFVSNRSGVDNIWAKAAGAGMDFGSPAPTTIVTAPPEQEQPDSRP